MEKQSSRVAIIVALIGACATVTGATIGVFAGKEQGEVEARQVQATATVTRTVPGQATTIYETAQPGASTSNPPQESPDEDERPIRWKGEVLLTVDGMDFDAQVPRDGNYNDFGLKSGAIKPVIWTTVYTWTAAAKPTYEQCLLKLDTQGLPRGYIYHNPKPGLGICFLTDRRAHLGFLEVKRVTRNGILINVTVWTDDQGG